MRIGITRAAQHQVDALLEFYLRKDGRGTAALRLLDDLADARALILADPSSGLANPRPYPALAAIGFHWHLVRAYWVSWVMLDGWPVLTNIFHVSADIEKRASVRTDDVLDW